MRSTLKRALVVLALGAAASAVHGPASAAPPGGPTDPQQLLRLSYASSGPWADNLSSPLFGPTDGPLVPGETIDKPFWVFGNPGTKAVLRLDCTIVGPVTDTGTGTEGENLFAERLDLAYQVNGDGYESCEEEHEPFTVTGRNAHRVDVRMMFEDLGDDQTGDMDQDATYAITVTLSQVPPKGGGKPQVLGAQTLLAEPPATETSGGTPTNDSGTTSERPGGDPTGETPSGKGGTKVTPARTTNASAVLPEPNVGLTESLPLIGGLLVAGALLAGFRRRRPEAE